MFAHNADSSTHFLIKKDRERLEKNGQEQKAASARGEDLDLTPVVKIFTPDGQCTWLLTEIYPDDPNLAFGLCDLGLGCPQLGDVDLTELERSHGLLGLPVEQDHYFRPFKTLSGYAEDALREGRIVT